jgi:hypothetical protein
MFGETTDPNLGHPHAPTVFDQRELLQRLEAARARRAHHIARSSREPDLLWEEPGLHGAGREINLRNRRPTIIGAQRQVQITPDMLLSPRLKSAAKGIVAKPAPMPVALPPVPAPSTMPGILTKRNAVIAAGVIGAAALGWYLWRRSQEKK